MTSLSVRAPAKVILTGEYAVLFGAPAIATAVSKFATTKIATTKVAPFEIAPFETTPFHAKRLLLTLTNFRQTVSSTLDSLRRVRRSLLENYKRLLVGRLDIRQVLKHPSQIFEFAFISLVDACCLELEESAWIQLESEIPIGCGMGSSAASVVSFIKALASYLKIERGVDWLFKLAVEVEHLQHGRSSGIDTYVSLHGGTVAYQEGLATPLDLKFQSMALVNTGKPQTTTGECVQQVKKQFATSSIWSDFSTVSSALIKASSTQELLESIRENERLLEAIQVVPKPVQSFIREVEARGGAAKICGAGAIRGGSGGMVALFGMDPEPQLLKQFGYTAMNVEVGVSGAQICSNT